MSRSIKNYFIMKKTLLKSVFFFVFSLFLVSCSEDGVDGIDGVDGVDGNANVIGSTEFSTSTTNWSSSFGGAIWTANLTGASAITQDVVNRGIVSVFRKYTNNGVIQWAALPDTNTNINISYQYGVGTITFLAQSTNAVAFSNPGAITFRYVVISPSNRMANPNTNWNDYEQVKSALNLRD
jgi:hypothetical protein